MKGISYKVWAHPSSRASLLLVHGLGANPTWWEGLGNFFLQNTYSSYAIDLRNSGSFEAFKSDLKTLCEVIRNGNPQKKIFAIGESMGALIALSMVRQRSPSTLSKVEGSMALKDKDLFNGLVCMSPAFRSKAPLKVRDYFKMFFPLLYNPRNKFKLPLSADMCTHDADFVRLIEADYNKDTLSTSKVLFDTFISQLYFIISEKIIDIPILFLLAGEDRLVDNALSKKIFSKLKSQDKALIEYDGMYHSLSIEVGKEKVFQDIFKWIDGRI